MRSNTPSQKRKRLRELLLGNNVVQAPGVYEAYGARLVQNAGFNAVYMTGNGVSATLLGFPDVGLVDLTMISDHARRVAHCVDIPLICDADTGYGNVVNVCRTMTEFEAAGVAAIHIEDQVSPKRCAQMEGARMVVDFSEAVKKIEAAVAARSDPDFVIIARTDAAESLGFEEALRRGRAFAAAGADVVFVELKACPDILTQIRRAKEEVGAALLVNMDAGPILKNLRASDAKAIGIDLGIYPGFARHVFGYAMTQALSHLQDHGSIGTYSNNMFNSEQYNAALGLASVENWEKRFS